MEFLNYKNYVKNIDYDAKGFAKDTNITFSSESNDNGFSHIIIKLIKKDKEKYIYKITAKEGYDGYDSVSSGTVTFNYDECGITSIENGNLYDIHDDSFIIDSSKFTHLIYKSSHVID